MKARIIIDVGGADHVAFEALVARVGGPEDLVARALFAVALRDVADATVLASMDTIRKADQEAQRVARGGRERF